jgi:hypothetical protein
MSLGLVIVLITAFGYISNTLNWRCLNCRVIRFLYYIGALVHETSHAVLCVLTGAKIEEFTVFSDQPRVVHRKSKLPFLGESLISIAPIAGGLLFLFLINRYLLGNYFVLPLAVDWHSWKSVLATPFEFLLQIDLLQWQSWVMVLLLFNVGAMLGPSAQDLKNMWPMLILLFLINSPALAGLGLVALGLIMANIILQIAAILLLWLVRSAR